MARDQVRRKGTCPGSPASRPAAVAPGPTPAAFRCAIRPQHQRSGRSPLGPSRPVRTSRKHSCRTSRSFPGLRGFRSLRIPKSVPPLGPGCCDDHRIRSAPVGLRRPPRSRTGLTDCADASGPRLSGLARCTCRGSTGRPWRAVAPCATSCRARGPESGPGPSPARLSGIAGCSVVSPSRSARSPSHARVSTGPATPPVPASSAWTTASARGTRHRTLRSAPRTPRGRPLCPPR